jgi:hypothetical protein
MVKHETENHDFITDDRTMTTTKRAMVSGLAFGAIVCTSIAGAYHIGYQKAAATALSDYDAAHNKGFEDRRLNAQKTTDAELRTCNYDNSAFAGDGPETGGCYPEQ